MKELSDGGVVDPDSLPPGMELEGRLSFLLFWPNCAGSKVSLTIRIFVCERFDQCDSNTSSLSISIHLKLTTAAATVNALLSPLSI